MMNYISLGYNRWTDLIPVLNIFKMAKKNIWSTIRDRVVSVKYNPEEYNDLFKDRQVNGLLETGKIYRYIFNDSQLKIFIKDIDSRCYEVKDISPSIELDAYDNRQIDEFLDKQEVKELLQFLRDGDISITEASFVLNSEESRTLVEAKNSGVLNIYSANDEIAKKVVRDFSRLLK